MIRPNKATMRSAMAVTVVLSIAICATAQDVSYAVLNPDANVPIPLGAELFSYSTPDGTLISQAGVESSRLMTSGRIFVDESDSYTGLGLVNVTETDATVTLSLRTESGIETARNSFSLKARNHVARFASELFPGLPTDFVGSLTFESTRDLAAITLRQTKNRRGEVLYATLPVVDLAAPADDTPLVFPQIAAGGGYSTQVILINRTGAVLHGHLTTRLFPGNPGSGESMPVIADYPYQLEPHGTSRFVVNHEYGLISGYAAVTPDAGNPTPGGTAIFQVKEQGFPQTEAGVLSAASTTAARILVDNLDCYTGVAVARRAAESGDLTFKLLDNGGKVVATVTRTLPGEGHIAVFVHEMFGDAALNFSGLLDISSTVAFQAVTLKLTINNRNEQVLTTLPVVDLKTEPPAGPLVFAHLAFGNGFNSRVILINRDDRAPATGRWEFFGSDGSPMVWSWGSQGKASFRYEVPGTGAKQAQMLQPWVIISPKDPSVPIGGTQQFTATVLLPWNASVTWTASPGTITPDGLYSAPSYPQTLLSQNYAEIGATVGFTPTRIWIKLVIPPPEFTGITPERAVKDQEISVIGKNFFFSKVVVTFSGPNGGEIRTPLRDAAITRISVPVPAGVVTGYVSVRAFVGEQACFFPKVGYLTRLPGLRIYSDQKDVAAGESVKIKSALLGADTPSGIVWSADVGSISTDGTYRAPAAVTEGTFARVSGCTAEGNVCQNVDLKLHRFRISPAAPAVAMGRALQLSVVPPAPDVRWSIESGGGTITQTGYYQASASASDSGAVVVAAKIAGVTQKVTIAVTGAIPGLVNRIYENSGSQNPTGPGPARYVASVAVAGNHAYVGASDGYPWWSTGRSYWIDVYDISDPVDLAWLTAVEAPGPVDSLYVYKNLLYAVSDVSLSVYDITGDTPVAKASSFPEGIQGLDCHSFSDGVLYALQSTVSSDIWILDGRAGAITSRKVVLPISDPWTAVWVGAVIGTGNRMFVHLQWQNLDSFVEKLATYDLASSPVSLIATTDVPELGRWTESRIVGNRLFSTHAVFDISSGLPKWLANLDYDLLDVQEDRVLARVVYDESIIVDIGDLKSPKPYNLQYTVLGAGPAIFCGNYVYSPGGESGIAIYDGLPPGGPHLEESFAWDGVLGWATDQIVRSPLLYMSKVTDEGGIVTAYDISTNPPAPVGKYIDTGQHLYSLALVQDRLMVGGDKSLVILDVSRAESPVRVKSMDFPISDLAAGDRILYAGTLDKRLAVFDVTVPDSPALLATITLPDLPLSLATRNSLLFIAAGSAGLLIYDVTVPSAPRLLTQFTTYYPVQDVALDGNLALVAALEGGLLILDTQDPGNPSLLAKWQPEPIEFGAVRQPYVVLVATHNGVAYVGSAIEFGTLWGVDYSTATSPRLISISQNGGMLSAQINTVAFSGTKLFINGACVRDISQPRNLILLGQPPER